MTSVNLRLPHTYVVKSLRFSHFHYNFNLRNFNWTMFFKSIFIIIILDDTNLVLNIFINIFLKVILINLNTKWLGTYYTNIAIVIIFSYRELSGWSVIPLSLRIVFFFLNQYEIFIRYFIKLIIHLYDMIKYDLIDLLR